MTITLREITADNIDAVRALRTTPDQERFVSSVTDSLDQAAENPQEHPWFRGAYADGQPVGFVMVSWNAAPQAPDTPSSWILWKLLIDRRHQGQGYGREFLRQVVDLVRADGATELLTSHVPGDAGPAGFYARLGFVPTGDVDPDGEIILRLRWAAGESDV